MPSLKVNPGILSIKPYVGGLSRASSEDVEIIKLSSNENALGASPKAIEAYKAAAHDLFRYPDGGSILLREAIAEVYDLDPNRIVCGAGSDEIIAFLCSAYAGIGDEVLYSEHGFLMYKISAQRVGAVPVVAKEQNLKTDVDSLLEKVTDKTRIVFVANPNNPTGTYISASELKRLRQGLRSDILLVIDGAYSEYVDSEDYSDGLELVNSYDNCIMTRTFSKIYGLASLRLGWSYGSEEVTYILNRVRGPFNVTGPAQEAGIAAVKDVAFTEQSKQHNTVSLAMIASELKQMGLESYPSYGNFFIIRFPNEAGKTALDANEFLMQKGIIPRVIANYQLPDYLRITVGTDKQNRIMLDALAEFSKK
ncbi:MAG: histidinol-phosphate transaminase [Rickettsiales bacterium]|nr:histidinol-phosphate transaminase [Rickettsiales bacterium]